MFLTPNVHSAMAMFGFVYAWYLTVVLLLEIWFDYRKDMILWSENETGPRRWIHRILTLGVFDLTESALRFDRSAGRIITIVGIPSAFLLHGYVGFIFGSVKANPWWSSVLMPIVFLFSAIVSGIALMLLLYMFTTLVRSKPIDMPCLDKLASFLFYALIVDFSLEMLDFIHRLYEAEESIRILGQLVASRLFISLVIVQALMGTIIPLILLASVSPALHPRRALVKLPDELRRLLYAGAAVLIQIGIFSTRWNVVIGGQLFSKSLRGLTVYKMQLLGGEGLFVAGLLLLLPFVILLALIKLLPPWLDAEAHVPLAEIEPEGDLQPEEAAVIASEA
jgi:Ni/Fe-hydrogenase subunit HybB-like protein